MNSSRIKSFFDYDDSYPTCDRTHARLCIYLPDANDPNGVSEKLGIQPSRTQVKGEIRNGKAKQWPTAWFIESTESVQSKELRRHINWILEKLDGKLDVIHELQGTDAEMHISCFWVSAVGHGGPMLDKDILKRIAELNIGISFDIYFEGDVLGEVLNNDES